jgi:hypothetical protein
VGAEVLLPNVVVCRILGSLPLHAAEVYLTEGLVCQDYGWRLMNGDVFRCVVLSKRERLKEVKVWIHVYDVILHMTKQNE